MKIKTTVSGAETLFDVLSRSAPMSSSSVKKLIKSKEAKVNGVRVGENVSLKQGDIVECFVPQAFIGEMPKIIFEDENILIVDKPARIEVVPTLTDMLGANRAYIKPLHRLDRNTVGLVVFALNETAYDELYATFADRRIEKRYVALTVGAPKVGEHVAYLFKDADKSVCYVSDKFKVGYKKIITVIEDVTSEGELSVVKILLATGRTHQIRAHLRHLGCPIVGDGKYGDEKINRRFGAKYQKLCAYSLTFKGLTGQMSYLNEKVFQSEQKLLTNLQY